MKKTIAVFMRHGSRWDSDKSVREQAYWDDHAQFMDALFADRVAVWGQANVGGGWYRLDSGGRTGVPEFVWSGPRS